MIIRYLSVLIGLIFLPVAALNLSGCAEIQGKGKIIKDVVYARQVPASFEAPLICSTDEKAISSLRFKWFSDNGTIKGDGKSTIWVAPSVPGTYKVGVNVTDGNGREDATTVNVQVVPFGDSLINVSPEISLQAPIWGDQSIGERQTVNPAITAEIEFKAPLPLFSKYTYAWSCNGGKIHGTGVKEGTASRIGWISPGVPGYYTVIAMITDTSGNTFVGCVYFNVVNPSCCGGNVTCGVQ